MRVFLLAAALVCLTVGSADAATCTSAVCTTMHDTIPNFAGQPTIQSVASGDWSQARTWDLGRVPTAADVVAIAAGTVVTLADTQAVARTIGVSGTLRARPDVATRLEVGTLLVLPHGRLEVGTVVAPVSASASLVIADQALDLSDDGVGVFDPRQFGTGLLSVDGVVTMAGASKTPWVRLAIEPRAGATTLTFSAPVVGWAVGDRLVLPDSRHITISQAPQYVYQGEEAIVASIAADGRSVVLRAPLAFAHPGARDGDDLLEFLPHVGNLSRTVTIQSANPAGTRGHILLTERSVVDVRLVEVRNLGRTTVSALDDTTFDAAGTVLHMGTNHVGRYPLHVHHDIGPAVPTGSGYQFIVDGLAVTDDAVVNRHKWAITVHGSHYGRIANNVVYNAGGWGIGIEDGSESFNEFASNFIVKVRGEGNRESPAAGNGIWLRGPNNYVRDNVIANVRGSVFGDTHGVQYYQVYLGTICVPNKPGADMTQCTRVNGNALPIREFARNEVYGAGEIGLALWWIGSDGYSVNSAPESLIKDFRAWHLSLYGIYGYPTSKLTIDGFVVRGLKSVLANAQEFPRGLFYSDYLSNNLTIRHADIQNMRDGLMLPYFSMGTTLVEDSYLRNATNVKVNTIGSPGAQPNGAKMPAKKALLRNVRFATPSGAIGQPPYDIHMNYWLQFNAANLVKSDVTLVESYNGVPGDDFQVFYNEQAPTFLVPQSSGNLVGAPVAGLTNAQTWSTYGLAIGGEVATGAVAKPRFFGLVRQGQAPPPLLPATVTLTGLTLPYTGAPQAVTTTTVPPGLTHLAVTYSGQAVAPTRAGSYPVVVTLTEPGYVPVMVSGTLRIDPAPLVVTPADETVLQDAALPTYTSTTTGLLPGETLVGAPVCDSVSSTATPGTFRITCALGTLNMPDYAPTFASGTLTVRPAPVNVAPPVVTALSIEAVGVVTRQRSTSTLLLAVASGASMRLSVEASDTSGLSYQWQRNSRNISGATAPAFSGPAVAGRYRCVLVNAAGRVLTTLVDVAVR